MLCHHLAAGGGSRAARLLLLVAVGALCMVSCGSRRRPGTGAAQPTVESGALFQVSPGEVFYFVDRFAGGKASPGLRRSADGALRIAIGEAHIPVLSAPAPYAIRQKVRLPEHALLRTAFGVASGAEGKPAPGVRFIVRLRHRGGESELLSREVRGWEGMDSPNWTPVTVDLGDVAGAEVEIELATELLDGGQRRMSDDPVSSYAVWVDPALVAPAPEPPPNIVLIVVDALRPDHLGCYGYHRQTSPFLDRLGREGVVFEDATAQATWTFPSVASILTSTHRITRSSHPDIMTKVLPTAEQDLADARPVVLSNSLQSKLRAAGYTTLGCVGGGFLDPALGFDYGFGWYWSPQRAPVLADELSALKRRLSEDPRAPFFLLLHTYEVHNYFQGWGHSLDQFDQGYLGPLTDPRLLEEACLRGRPEDLSAEDRQYIHDLYDGEILHTDRYLRLFLEWLLAQPWGANTIVVVTADHGESLGDHGAMSHGGTPYHSVARVPLIFRLPDGRGAGRRAGRPVALSDLMPTLLELSGLEAPQGLAGRSLVPALEGQEQREPSPIFSEGRGADLLARDGHWCYITRRGEGKEQLYDIERDPGQANNLASSHAAQLGRMRRVLAALVMEAARGHRLAAIGSRPGKLTIEIEADQGLSYLTVPTLQESDRVSVPVPIAGASGGPAGARQCRVQIELAPGDDPHVVLFEPADPAATVRISAAMDGNPVPADRFHLGRSGNPPDRTPIALGPGSRPMLAADQPPARVERQPWGLWLWLPPGAAESMLAPPATGELPADLVDQLRSLGYVR